MKTILKYSFFVVGIFGLLVFSQCRKSDRNNEAINPAPEENAIASIVFNDLFRVVHAVSIWMPMAGWPPCALLPARDRQGLFELEKNTNLHRLMLRAAQPGPPARSSRAGRKAFHR